MNAIDLYEIVRDVPREAWPSMLRNHSTFDPDEPERFWIIYGPMGGDDKRCVHITADIAELAFIGSMTAWLAAKQKYPTHAIYKDNALFEDHAMVSVNNRQIAYRQPSLVAALAAACKEAA